MYPNTVTTAFEECFDIKLDCFRNQDWTPTFLLIDDTGTTVDITNYKLELFVAPMNDDGTLGPTLISATTFTLGPEGEAQFIVQGSEISQLSVLGVYSWYLLQLVPPATGSSVLVCGPLCPKDAPAFV